MSAPLPLVDTHTHLCDPVFDLDRQAVIDRAKSVGVISMLLAGETLEDARRNLALARRHPELKPAAGLYPAYLDWKMADEMIEFIRKNREELIAIGEVGLDYWRAKEEEERATQREIFSAFIDLALELDLPLNVHSRSAGKYAVPLLLDKGAKRVQMHAFDGKHSAALAAVEAGYYFSIPASILRSQQKRQLVSKLPLSCLLIETDSPVLGPDRDQRNEPANAPLAAKAVAELKQVTINAVREAAWENAKKLYGEAIT